jgi:hypothetical protein
MMEDDLSISDIVTKLPLVDQIDLANRIEVLFRLFGETATENIYLKEKIRLLDRRIRSLENIIRPDEVDNYNLNRRIEILAQRISLLESKPKHSWRGLFGLEGR